MKCIRRIKKALINRDGGSYLMPIFCGIAIASLLAIVGSIMSADLVAMEVKKTAKQQMNNLSNEIVEDTYNAMVQGDLTEYHNELHSSLSYQSYLLEKTIHNIADDLGLRKIGNGYYKVNTSDEPMYHLSDFKIEQEISSDNRIRYIISFSLTIHFKFAGKTFDGFVFPVSYDTFHIKND